MRKVINFIVFFMFLIPSLSLSYSYSTIIGNIDGCSYPLSGYMSSAEQALGCTITGTPTCELEFLLITPVTCPDVFTPDPSLIFSNVGNTVGTIVLNSVPLGTEGTAARDAFLTWNTTSLVPNCPTPYVRGATGEGYAFTSTMSPTNPSLSDLNITVWKRSDCSPTGASTTLTPIPSLGGGGSTDMTATNNLLTQIQSNTSGLVSPGAIDVNIVSGGGGGGGSTDMTATNNLIAATNTGIAGVGSSIDAMSAKFDGVYTGGDGSGQPVPVIDKTGKETAFLDSSLIGYNDFQASVKSTPLYNSLGTFFNGVPSVGGISTFTVSAGRLGSHSIDLSSYGTVWNIIKALVLIVCSYVSVKIIFLGRS